MYSFKEEYTLNFSEVKYIYDVHQIIKKEFDFPDYYGENWDAFWDSITDIASRPLHIKLIGIERLQKEFSWDTDVMLKAFKDLKHWANDRYINQIKIEIIIGNASYEIH